VNSRYSSRARRRKQPASPDQLELPFPEIQLELPLKPEPRSNLEPFENFLSRMRQAQTKRNPDTSNI
jgi:hypothetical protein